MNIVTGASQNHVKSLNQFIESVYPYQEHIQNLIIYNLGINDSDWESIKIMTKSKNIENTIFKAFDYNRYPKWYDINVNAGEYAWKSAIIMEIYSLFPNTILFWMDAGNKITGDLVPLINDVKINGLYSGPTGGDIKKWTHANTLEILQPVNITLMNRNGACIGFDLSKSWVQNFITEFAEYCSNKDCIAPKGSSRKNHRQDQAILTILYYKYQDIWNFKMSNFKFKCYTIHNDID